MLKEETQRFSNIKEEQCNYETSDKPHDSQFHHEQCHLTLQELDKSINKLMILFLIQSRMPEDTIQIGMLINKIDQFNEHSIQRINEISSCAISKLAFLSTIAIKNHQNMKEYLQKLNYLKHRLINRQTDLLRDPLQGYKYYLHKNMKLPIKIQCLMSQTKQQIKKEQSKQPQPQTIIQNHIFSDNITLNRLKEQNFSGSQ